MNVEIKKGRSLVAGTIIAVLALSILSLSIPVQSDKDEQDMDSGEFKFDIKAQDEEIRLKLEVDDDSGILDGSYEITLDCNVRPEGQENPILSGTLIVENSEGELKLEASALSGDYAQCALTFPGFEPVGEFTLTVGAQELQPEEEAKELGAKARAAKMAQKAKEAIQTEGKPEFVKGIDKAERYLGKADKAVVALKIGLESDDVDSIGFGSAHLVLIKFGEREPMFRAVLNILTDQPVDKLSACLDGQYIGELTIIHASEELGLYIGHLRKSLTGVESITIPGVSVDVVEGTDCKTTLILSGTV
ncbi:MAG: hypothetical protein ACE5J2_05510 [Nitrososphaerales archaeon]